jgi:7-cyano-7-deazaguanine synthase
MRKVVVVSGGLESSVVLAQVVRAGVHAQVLFVDYGQRAVDLERRSVVRQCLKYGAAFHEAAVQAQFLEYSFLSDPHVRAFKSDRPEVSTAHIVPFRNLFILSLAASLAATVTARHIVTGFDFREGSPGAAKDTSKEFTQRLEEAILAASHFGGVEIENPVLGFSKKEVVLLGESLEVDWSLSWSCYNGDNVHCGECGACVARKRGFLEAGVTDQTEYQT